MVEAFTPPARITRSHFGQFHGAEVALYTLTNRNGAVLKVINYGAIVTELLVRGRDGELADVVRGFDDLQGYLENTPYFGATIGRVANRIKGGTFELEGQRYALALNDPATGSHLHGGRRGWDKVVWNAEADSSERGPSIKLSYTSADGEEGYPGRVQATVLYSLTDADEFRVEMRAMTDRTTLVNMAHHTYWNLGGPGSSSIAGHELTLHAKAYTPGLPPAGAVEPVAGTRFDFTTAQPIGPRLQPTGYGPGGFDDNFVVDGAAFSLRPVARVRDPGTGRVMALESDQPGVQFYTGNFLDGSTRGKGSPHVRHSAFCLESQRFPNSIHVPAWRDSVILVPGRLYSHTMIHRFTVE